MKRPLPRLASKVLVKDQAARARAKRKVVAVDKSSEKAGDPFALFTEWSGDADEKAYADLR
jgi:hypothetical protein